MSAQLSHSSDKPRKKGLLASRRSWFKASTIPVVFWVLVVLAALVGQRWRADLDWIALHAAALGVATNAIVIWSDYFADGLMRGAPTRRARQLTVLGLLNLGIIALMGGIEAALNPLVIGGVAAIVVAIAVHFSGLWRRSRGRLVGALGVTVVRYYVACGAWFIATALFGFAMTTAGGVHLERFLLAHIASAVLGTLGLAVIGTLVTLWPTIVRTKMVPGAEADARRALPLLNVSVAVVVAGGISGFGWIAALGVLGYVACLGFTGVMMAKLLRAKPARSFAAFTVIAGMAWFAGTLTVAAIMLATSADSQAIMNRMPELAWPLLGGFAAQLIAGSMAYLLPMVIGGGPGVVRHRNQVMDAFTDARVVAANGAGLGLLLPLPMVGRIALGAVIVACALTFLVLVLASGRVSSQLAMDQIPEPTSHGHGVVLGVGVLVTALAIATAVSPSGMVGLGGSDSGSASGAGNGQTQHVAVDARDMSFTPNAITVSAGTHLYIDVTNTDTGGMVHDLVLASGATSGRLSPGDTGTLDAGVLTESTDAWCSIAGHKQMGMTMTITVEGAASSGSGSDSSSSKGASNAASADPDAQMSVAPWNAALQPASTETEHHLLFDVTEAAVEVAPGVTQMRWMFNGQAPGPVLRGHLGDKFVITLQNHGTMGHSIDFHAGALAPDEPMRTIAPGEELTYTFTATKAGVWMYHCSTAPMSLHIANGMFGAVIIDPPGLTQVDQEYLMIQSEHWYGAQGESNDADRIGDGQPDAVVFNGYANQYDVHPLTSKVGNRVRFWVLDVGPDEPLSFHVVGAQFDTVWSEGAFRLECGYQPAADVNAACGRGGQGSVGPGGSQTLSLGAAEGGYVEMVAPEAGHFSIVNHIMTDAEKGAHGVLQVSN